MCTCARTHTQTHARTHARTCIVVQFHDCANIQTTRQSLHCRIVNNSLQQTTSCSAADGTCTRTCTRTSAYLRTHLRTYAYTHTLARACAPNVLSSLYKVQVKAHAHIINYLQNKHEKQQEKHRILLFSSGRLRASVS